MTEQQYHPSLKQQESEVLEETQEQVTSEAEGECSNEQDADDSLEVRLKVLTTEYAYERAALAEQISLLQEENDRLTLRVQELQDAAQTTKANVANLSIDARQPERALGLNFSMLEEQLKG